MKVAQTPTPLALDKSYLGLGRFVNTETLSETVAIISTKGDSMKYEDLMDFKNIFFLGLNEPSCNSLSLFFSRSKVSDIPEPLIINGKNLGDSYSVNVDEDSPVIQIDFESYIGYSVLNESYTSWDEYQVFAGKSFRIYSKSRYLDFISVGTFASEDYPGPFKHYGVVCYDHIIDVVSSSCPIIKEAERSI